MFVNIICGLFGQNETSKETKDCTIQGVLDGVYKGTKVYLVEEERLMVPPR